MWRFGDIVVRWSAFVGKVHFLVTIQIACNYPDIFVEPQILGIELNKFLQVNMGEVSQDKYMYNVKFLRCRNTLNALAFVKRLPLILVILFSDVLLYFSYVLIRTKILDHPFS